MSASTHAPSESPTQPGPSPDPVPDFLGTLNFQSARVPRGLASDGSVFADVDSNTGGFKRFVGTDEVPVRVPIYDGRRAAEITLDGAGFELRAMKKPEINFYDEQQVLTEYYERVCEFVKQATGAYKVVAFDHVVRNSGVGMNYEKREGDGGEVVKIGGPAVVVHGDYAMKGAPKRRDDFALPPKFDDTFRKTHGDRPLIAPAELATLQGRRFAVVNLWRSIVPEPVVDRPLTMCDCRTVTAQDYIPVEFRYDDRVFETYLGGHADRQRWYYFPQMTQDEVVLLKTYDSQGKLWKDQKGYAAFDPSKPTVPVSSTLHSAVEDPRLGANFPKRQSIEVRTMVFY